MPPATPAPTPEQEALKKQMIDREMAKGGAVSMLDKASGATGDFLKGIFGDPAMPRSELDKSSPWKKAGLLAAAAPLGMPHGIPGLWSRAERVVEGMPATINANRAASLLKSGASKDETAFRGIDKVLEASKGKPIQKADLAEHLAKNPINVKVTKRGNLTPDELPDQAAVNDWYYKFYAQRPSSDAAALQAWSHNHSTPTKYGDYVMKDAVPDSYRETVLSLDKPAAVDPNPVDEWVKKYGEITQADDNTFTVTHPGGIQTTEGLDENAAMNLIDQLRDQTGIRQQADLDWADLLDAQRKPKDYFASTHFDEPNILAWIRHNDRYLPNKDNPEEIGNQVYELAKQNPDASVADLERQLGVNQKGRMLENIQSEWHQKGSRVGYNTPEQRTKIEARDTEEAIKEAASRNARVAMLQSLNTSDLLHRDYGGSVHEMMSDLANRGSNWRDAPFFARTPTDDESGLIEAYVNARNDLHDWQYNNPAPSDPVPDAPFKQSWPDLAIKQQIMDVADRPDLEWIGIAPSSELHNRGESVSPDFQDKRLPLILDKLLKPFGGKVEKATVYERPFELNAVSNPPASNTTDEILGRLGMTPQNIMPAQIEVRRTGIGHGEQYDMPIASVWPRPNIPYYDANPDYYARELQELIEHTNPSATAPEQIQAFIARLTPEMKAAIKEKGFPLLAALFAAYQTQGQSQHAK